MNQNNYVKMDDLYIRLDLQENVLGHGVQNK